MGRLHKPQIDRRILSGKEHGNLSRQKRPPKTNTIRPFGFLSKSHTKNIKNKLRRVTVSVFTHTTQGFRTGGVPGPLGSIGHATAHRRLHPRYQVMLSRAPRGTCIPFPPFARGRSPGFVRFSCPGCRAWCRGPMARGVNPLCSAASSVQEPSRSGGTAPHCARRGRSVGCSHALGGADRADVQLVRGKKSSRSGWGCQGPMTRLRKRFRVTRPV